MSELEVNEQLYEDITKFDKESADDLLKNIRNIGDIFNIMVPEYGLFTTGKQTQLKMWFIAFRSRVRWDISGKLGEEISNIIFRIRLNNYIMMERMEEMYRRLILISDKKDLYIEYQKKRIAELEEENNSLKQLSNITQDNDSVEPKSSVDNAKETNVQTNMEALAKFKTKQIAMFKRKLELYNEKKGQPFYTKEPLPEEYGLTKEDLKG